MASSVRELLTESAEARRRGDVEAMVELYHPNAAIFGPCLGPIVGKEAVTQWVTNVVAQTPDDLEHEITEEHIHGITPDVAIVDTVGTSRAGDVSAVEGFTMIAVRGERGEWLWAGIRGALVAP